MKFVPTSACVLCRRVGDRFDDAEADGIAFRRENVELFEVVDVSLTGCEIPFSFSPGDVVVCIPDACVELPGTGLVLVGPGQIAAKVCV